MSETTLDQESLAQDQASTESFQGEYTGKDYREEELSEDVRWILAKEAVCKLGIPQKEAAEKYSLSYDALKQRSCREKWPTIERIARVVTERSLNEKKAEIAAESWLERGESHRGIAFQVAHKAVKQAMLAPPEVKDWADLERADKMARRAAGLEQEGIQQSNSFTFTLVKDTVGLADSAELVGENGQIREIIPEMGALPE